MDPLVVGGLALAGSTLANGFFSQRSAAYNQKMVEKNTKLNYKYSQLAQQNAPVNEVYGLKAAGLSPVFANGAQGMATSAGSAGTAQAPSVDPANLLMFAQLKNLDAQADKTAADAESVKIDNMNKKQRDAAYGVMIDADLEHLKTLLSGDSKAVELIDQYMALPKSQGFADAYERTLQLLPKTFGSRADLIAEGLREQVNNAKKMAADPTNKQGAEIFDNPFLKSLAQSDTATIDKTIADIAKVMADTDNVKETLELIKKQEDFTAQDIKRLKALTDQIRNSDIRTLMEKGEYGQAILSLLTGFLMAFTK